MLVVRVLKLIYINPFVHSAPFLYHLKTEKP